MRRVIVLAFSLPAVSWIFACGTAPKRNTGPTPSAQLPVWSATTAGGLGASIDTGTGTFQVIARDHRTDAAVDGIEVSVAASNTAAVGLAFDPEGRYLPRWFSIDAPESGKRQAPALAGTITEILLIATAQAAGDSPDPAVVQTSLISGTGPGDFLLGSLLGSEALSLMESILAVRFDHYARSVRLGELDNLLEILAAEGILKVADGAAKSLLSELIGTGASGGVSLLLTVAELADTLEKLLLAKFWRAAGYEDDDWFDIYYRSLASPVPGLHNVVYVVIWPRNGPPPSAFSRLTGTYALSTIDDTPLPDGLSVEWTYVGGQLQSIRSRSSRPEIQLDLILNTNSIGLPQTFDVPAISGEGKTRVVYRVLTNDTTLDGDRLTTTLRMTQATGYLDSEVSLDGTTTLSGTVSSDLGTITGTATQSVTVMTSQGPQSFHASIPIEFKRL